MIKAEKVKISQLALILLIVIPGGKYLSLPSYMYSISGRDSWLSFLLLFVLDFVCFLFTLWAINLNRRGLSLNEILTQTLSPVGSKIIFAVFTVFFLLRVTVLLLGCVDLFSSTFVINTNWLAYIIPIALLVAVSLVQGVRNVARLTEMLFVFVMLALLIYIAVTGDASQGSLLYNFIVSPCSKAVWTAASGLPTACFCCSFSKRSKRRKKRTMCCCALCCLSAYS